MFYVRRNFHRDFNHRSRECSTSCHLCQRVSSVLSLRRRLWRTRHDDMTQLHGTTNRKRGRTDYSALSAVGQKMFVVIDKKKSGIIPRGGRRVYDQMTTE